jgi:hypothetical protein
VKRKKYNKIKKENHNSKTGETKKKKKPLIYRKSLPTFIISWLPFMVMTLPLVGELAVDITAHCHRALHRLYVPLLYQNRSRLIAKRFHLCLWQQLALHRMLDLTVQIHTRRHRFQSLSLSMLRSAPPRSPIS